MLHSLLCLFSLGLPPAQQTVTWGDVIRLPMIGSSSTHATVAVNDRGDVFVAWSSAVSIQGTKTKQVEGVLLQQLSPGVWSVPDATTRFMLGLPGVAANGEIERCHKPDVVSLGPDFLITWPRIQNGSQAASLEFARIRVDATGNATLDALSPGKGWTLDPSFQAGDAGGMPDAMRLKYDRKGSGIPVTGKAAVFYAHMTRSSGDQRDFDLRAVHLDFSTSPPQIFGPVTAASNLPVDFTGSYPGGGMLLPDGVEDDLGNIVVAWEEFTSTTRGTAVDEGLLRVSSFRPTLSGLILNDSLEFRGTDLDDRQRRPNLSTSSADRENTVSLAWVECEKDGSDPRARYGLLNFSGGAINFLDGNLVDTPGVEEWRPTCIQGQKLKAAVLEWVAPTSQSMVAWSPSAAGGNWINIPLAGLAPLRPAVTLLEDAQHPVGSRVLPLSFEVLGTTPTGGKIAWIYLAIFRV